MGKNWEMWDLELQLNPVRPINPKGEKKYCLITVTKTHSTLTNGKKQPVKTNCILIIENKLGSHTNELNKIVS